MWPVGSNGLPPLDNPPMTPEVAGDRRGGSPGSVSGPWSRCGWLRGDVREREASLAGPVRSAIVHARHPSRRSGSRHQGVRPSGWRTARRRGRVARSGCAQCGPALRSRRPEPSGRRAGWCGCPRPLRRGQERRSGRCDHAARRRRASRAWRRVGDDLRPLRPPRPRPNRVARASAGRGRAPWDPPHVPGGRAGRRPRFDRVPALRPQRVVSERAARPRAGFHALAASGGSGRPARRGRGSRDARPAPRRPACRLRLERSQERAELQRSGRARCRRQIAPGDAPARRPEARAARRRPSGKVPGRDRPAHPARRCPGGHGRGRAVGGQAPREGIVRPGERLGHGSGRRQRSRARHHTGWCFLANLGNGLVLRQNSSSDHRTKATGRLSPADAYQQWKIVQGAGGSYQIVNRASGLALGHFAKHKALT